MPVILLLILCWPFIEIAGFIYVGEHIGILPTIALTLLSTAIGAMLLRSQGLAVLRKMQAELRSGVVPAAQLGHAALIAFAGLCLFVPGFVSDIIGLLLFLPPVRSLILSLLARNMRIVVRTSTRSETIVDLDREDWQDVSGSHVPPSAETPPQQPRLIGPAD